MPGHKHWRPHGSQVPLSATCVVPASTATFCLSVAAGMCEDHVTLTDLCQAVWHFIKSHQILQEEKMLATSCHTLSCHTQAHTNSQASCSCHLVTHSWHACLRLQSPLDFSTATFLVLLAGEGVKARKPPRQRCLARLCKPALLLPANAWLSCGGSSDCVTLQQSMLDLAAWNLSSTVRCEWLDLQPICAVADTAAYFAKLSMTAVLACWLAMSRPSLLPFCNPF